VGQRHAPQQGGGGKARQIAAGTAAQRYHAAGAVEAITQDVAAQLLIDGDGLGVLTGGDEVQRGVQSGGAETVQHGTAVKTGGSLVGHHGPAGGRRGLPQQGTGPGQQAAADVHGVGGGRELDGELFHVGTSDVCYWAYCSAKSGVLQGLPGIWDGIQGDCAPAHRSDALS